MKSKKIQTWQLIQLFIEHVALSTSKLDLNFETKA